MSRRIALGIASLGLALALALPAAGQVLERQMAAMANPPSTKNPFAGNAAAVEEGHAAYNKSCTGCHGANGAAGEFAPGLAEAGRAYARRTDEQIFGAIKDGITGTRMPAFKQLPDDTIWKMTAYIYGLRGTAIDAPTDGDAAAGKLVFEGKGECLKCHMVSGKGSVVGPDLTTIANKRKVLVLHDALVKANNRVMPPGGYQSYELVPMELYTVVNITTTDGKTIRGVLRNQDSYSLQVMGLDEKLYLLDTAKVASVTREPGRLMPSDYDKRLSPKEFADLMAYITRLGNANAPRPQVSRGGGGD
jgi:putative heme-binding domain-containing protein